MYKIWFKWALGGDECFADCPTVELARRTWGRTTRRRRFYDVREALRSIKMEDYVVVELDFDEIITLE